MSEPKKPFKKCKFCDSKAVVKTRDVRDIGNDIYLCETHYESKKVDMQDSYFRFKAWGI